LEEWLRSEPKAKLATGTRSPPLLGNELGKGKALLSITLGILTRPCFFIKSHLFANLTVRSCCDKFPAGSNAIVWTQVKGFPAKDQSETSSALTALRQGCIEPLLSSSIKISTNRRRLIADPAQSKCTCLPLG
jgi:hypothetical protein